MVATMTDTRTSKVDSNSVSLAGEFAVLAQLALRGYDANMTLGRTKNVDILVSDPNSTRMLQLEVKTNFRKVGASSRIHGKIVSAWIMNQKHEQLRDPTLFYCFVNIATDTKHFRFFVVPSNIVADYVTTSHKVWLQDDSSHQDSTMRKFVIGTKMEKYRFPTATKEDWEDNWDFNS